MNSSLFGQQRTGPCILCQKKLLPPTLRFPYLQNLHLPRIPEHAVSLCLVKADGEELAASLTPHPVRQETSKLSLVMNLFFRMTCMILNHNVAGSDLLIFLPLLQILKDEN